MRDIILIVDDVEMNRDILSSFLAENYRIIEACDGLDALNAIEQYKNELAAVLLDLVMPGMDGYEVMQKLNLRDNTNPFPVLIISGESSADVEEHCLELGVYDFIRKPFNAASVRHRIHNATDLYNWKNNLEERVEEQTQELILKNERLTKVNEDTLELLGNLVEARSHESGTHIRRVKGFTKILAERMMTLYPEYELTQEKVDVITNAAALHDVGKIMVPDAILNKPGKLTKEEFEEIKKHTTYSKIVLESCENLWDPDYYQICNDICLYHHEKYDGGGYPEGLKGDDIPISAQIVSLADVYDALTTERVYKKAFSPDTSYKMIFDGECGLFNPKILKCFADCKQQFLEQVLITGSLPQ